MAFVGRSASSPSEPADSNPANDRKPAVAASPSVASDVPSGRSSTDAVMRCGPGASPVARRTTTTAMSARMSTTETTSTTSSDRADVLISRVARNPITAQPARAIGSQGGSCAMPVPSRNATPKIRDGRDRHGREHEVRAEHDPAGEEAGPRADGLPDERVDRARAREHPRQAHESVGDEAHAESGEQVRERRGAPEETRGLDRRDRHRKRGRHDPDGDRGGREQPEMAAQEAGTGG